MEWVMERLTVIGYTNHVMSADVCAQKSKIQSDSTRRSVRRGSYKISARQPEDTSAGKSLKLNRKDCILLLIVSRVD